MPAARALRDFLVAEGRQFLPNAADAIAPRARSVARAKALRPRKPARRAKSSK
jgi:hypothetical protein